MSVPVIDLFAGPGGLGEGFSRLNRVPFRVAVSVEKDGMAYETLRMRAAHRHLMHSTEPSRAATWSLWDSIVAGNPWNIAFDSLRESGNEAIVEACAAAASEAWDLELGPGNRALVSSGIRSRLRPYMRGSALPKNTVLIGGPPCQAYSVVGRSRNRGTQGYKPEEDARHFLYREYLHVIAEFRPAVFIMENVKGILSSTVADHHLFSVITEDLKRPDLAVEQDVGLEYQLVALPHGSTGVFDPNPKDYIIEAETHGIPQARHRVIICGVRKDVFERAGRVKPLRSRPAPTVIDAIGDMPRLRPELSFRGRGEDWRRVLHSDLAEVAIAQLRSESDPVSRKVASAMRRARAEFRRQPDPGTGDDHVYSARDRTRNGPLHAWYRDRPLSLLSNHVSRSHMPSDLVRYLFVSSFGAVTGSSPRLGDFPTSLLPDHRNVDPDNASASIFKDRFRVQVADRCSMTVTSHIAKDGHAFIHPDPSQCRSLSVREAARLQTFPDSYLFLGNRTSQYTQVGNAVPPMLAHQIADLVADVLERAGFA